MKSMSLCMGVWLLAAVGIMGQQLKSVTATVDLAAAVQEPKPVTIKVEDDTIEFRIGDQIATRYHKASSVAKPYLWPLHAPSGAILTRAWPMEKGKAGETVDHVHQKSAWFCHGDVIPEGVEVKTKINHVEGFDFWSEAKGHGRIICVRVDEPRLGANEGQIATYNEWHTPEGTKILEEKRTIKLVDYGTARLFVFDIVLAATTYPITFGDTKEGSFGIRINDALREDLGKGKKGTGVMTTADGKVGEKNLWGRPAAWCDYSGPLDGKTVGLTIFDDPSNPPAHWHSRGYGLMAANPFGREKSGFPAMAGKKDLIKLAKGDHLKLRYGILVHDGDANTGKVADFYAKFVQMGASK